MKRVTLSIILVLIIIMVNSLTLFSCNIKQPTIDQTSITTQTASIIKQVKWNLSGTVMPEPQYGSRGISGSERASVLTVDQTNTQVQITGEMSGLKKSTSYTVLLANSYVPKTVYPGLFTSKVNPFMFINDPIGVYRWTFILFNDDFPGPGTYTLSIWINETQSNEAALISDNFEVTVK